MRRFLVFAPACLLLVACSGEGGDTSGSAASGSANGSSVLAEPYRTSFEQAWQAAGEGRSPSTACASVVGTAVGLISTTASAGQDRRDAVAALDACYVGAMVRFVDTTLAVENAGTSECVKLITALPTHRRSLGSLLGEAGEDVAVYDRRLTDQIGAKVRSACADMADVILGE